MSKFTLSTCYEPLWAYKCFNCNYETQEKVKIFRHNCGIEEEKSEVMFKLCERCKVKSWFLAGGMCERGKCTFNKNKFYFKNMKKIQKRNVDQPTKYAECAQCDCKYRSPYKLKIHMKNKHTPVHLQKWYQCDQCPFRTNIRSSLQRHILALHAKALYECDKCDFKTATHFYLQRHNKNKHLSDDLQTWFQCDRCEWKTKFKSDLKKHIMKKHVPSDLQQCFRCDQCEYKTLQKATLKNHVNRKHDSHEMWYECKQCEYKTRHEVDLEKHRFRRHLSNTEISFECDQCKFRAKKEHVLIRHITKKHSLLGPNLNQSKMLQKDKSSKNNLANLPKWFDCDQNEYGVKQ